MTWLKSNSVKKKKSVMGGGGGVTLEKLKRELRACQLK